MVVVVGAFAHLDQFRHRLGSFGHLRGTGGPQMNAQPMTDKLALQVFTDMAAQFVGKRSDHETIAAAIDHVTERLAKADRKDKDKE